MLTEGEKDPVHVVDFGSSEDEDGSRVQKRHRKSVSQPLHPRTHISGSRSIPPRMDSSNESRCFWRAGDYDVVPSKSAAPQGQLEHARVHPKFLHSNATSHKWAFGAIAELLDNAVDEVRNGATFVKVDKIYNMRDNSPALLFQDNGGGMNPEGLRLCMSLGYSSKKANTTIGQYGNGFKTSTMRLGADVIVFSRANHGSRATQSVGLLSYTFLRRTGKDDVIVPMVDFELTGHQTQPIIYSSEDDWSNNLKLILEWSPFPSKDELMRQFDDIGVHGTKVIIYNLWLNDEGVLELDFYNDEEDVRLRDEVDSGKLSKIRESDRLVQSHVSYLMRYSLRAYASILYLRKFTNFNIIIRGKPVEQLNFAGELKSPSVVTYKPQLGMTSKEVSVKITIGFVKEAPNLGVYGFNVYHKNRLIRPFWRVNHDASSRGKGVVGVLEANFIEPAHDKQDFERSALFLRLETKLKQMVTEYWTNHCHLIGLDSINPEIRNRQKDCLANLQEEGHLYQPVIGLSANLQQGLGNAPSIIGLPTNSQMEPTVQSRPVIGLAANLQQGLGNTPSMIGLAANSQMEPTVQSRPVIGLAANLQQGLGNTPSIIGLAANSQKEPTVRSRPIIGLAANLQQGLGNSSIIGLAANIQKESTVQPIIGLTAGSFTGVASSGGYNATLLDKICEENIQLFTKCEGHRQREINLKQTIEELERELEEARRKCSKLSSDLEHRRNQKTMNQQSEKA